MTVPLEKSTAETPLDMHLVFDRDISTPEQRAAYRLGFGDGIGSSARDILAVAHVGRIHIALRRHLKRNRQIGAFLPDQDSYGAVHFWRWVIDYGYRS